MDNKDYTADITAEQRDDVLFETLGKNKKRKKRRILITVVSIVLALAVLAVVSVFALQQRVRKEFATGQGEVLSSPVNVGTINAVVTGTGTLAEMDLEAITVPKGVEVTEILVETNQTVSPGTVLAMVDMTSVMNTLADLQAQIEALDKQISKAEDDAVSTEVTAGVSGRVKAVYGKAGDNVADVMVSNGALALLSLDGYMAASVRTSVLAAGDNVSVVLSDGKKLSGFVEAVEGSYATVLVTDKGTLCGDKVKVFNSAGEAVGPGTLEIHSPLRVTAYAGTIASVKIAAEDTVSENARLFTLKDTDYNASYHTLLRQRAELEQTMMALLTIQRDGAVVATYPGGVYSVDHSEKTPEAVVTLSADDRVCVTVSVDESDILSLSMGQRATVTVPSVGNEAYTGLLMEVNRSATSAGTFSAVVELNKEEGMLPGMTANVTIRVRGVEGALRVPVAAVHKTRNGAYVYTSYDPKTQKYGDRVDVVTGLENSMFVEIISGIGIGDTVYYTEKQDNSSYGSFGSGQMPGFGGNSGGQRPSFGNTGSRPNGGQTPSFGGSRG